MCYIVFMIKTLKLISLSLISLSLTGCGLFSSGNTSASVEYEATTGKFFLLDEEKKATDNYFLFDGSKGKMSFSYYEGGNKKIDGTFRVIIPEEKGKDRTYCFSYAFDKKDGEKEDILYCYSDDFSSVESFTQFTIMEVEKKYVNSDRLIDFHTYRYSELPYKMGTYVREDKQYQVEKDEYAYADKYFIPNGTYYLGEDTYFTSFYTKKRRAALFVYSNNEVTYEGIYNVSDDKKSMYFYISHDIYQKVTREDKEKYDTTFSLYYPPDLNVHGDFEVDENNNYFKINSFDILKNAPSFKEGYWKTGTYIKA